MSSASHQLVLDLPHRPALGAEDFLISESNRAAADIVDRWPDWPQAAVVVVAPPRSGKTHLANVWRRRSGAARLEARSIGEADVQAASACSALLIEDLHAGIGDERAMTAPGHRLGAHQSDPTLCGPCTQLAEPALESFRQHVVGESSEARVPPAAVR